MKLFDRKDILTIATADQAVIGDKGYFGNGLTTLDYNVERNDVKTLFDVNTNETSCFIDHEDLSYFFFLPADKVKDKEPTYRPLKNLNELFDFFYPPKDDVYSQTEKAEILLGEKITLKNKTNDRITTMVIQELNFNSDGSDVFLNGDALEYLSGDYKIQINDKFIPFGVEE